ncbi:MAG: alpha/beta fold hydrolase [Desulfococcaceae bacterium]
MPEVESNGIQLFYETFGDRNARPLALVIGLATPRVAWPEPFCRKLAEAGHYVVRFDNRDCGRSQKMDHMEIPDLEKLMGRKVMGQSLKVPYALPDMADDTVGLLDALELETVHLCGMSMGGMIGQIVALEHPKRLKSLIPFMSTTGEPDLPPSTPAAREAMMGVPPQGSREAYQDYLVKLCRVFADDSELYDPKVQAEIAGEIYDMGLYPAGFLRQMAAILASEGRRERLKSLKVPSLVLHGDRDTVVPIEHGKDIANAIPGARFREFKGLGHGTAFPSLWDEIVGEISAFTAEAE